MVAAAERGMVDPTDPVGDNFVFVLGGNLEMRQNRLSGKPDTMRFSVTLHQNGSLLIGPANLDPVGTESANHLRKRMAVDIILPHLNNRQTG